LEDRVTDEEPSLEEEQSTLGLLERVRSGDRSAGETLFRQHQGRLRRALRARMAPEIRPVVERDELVQETFTEALRSLAGFEWRGQGAFLAWLLQIATHSLQDRVRRERLAPLESLEDSSGERRLELAHDSATPSQAAAQAEELQLLERALDSLAEDERDAVIRRKILGQDYVSLAQDLGLTEGGARMRVSRALVEMTRWAQRYA
jgi:RNA polymerase sigma-70 factor (ECF subfamily)